MNDALRVRRDRHRVASAMLLAAVMVSGCSNPTATIPIQGVAATPTPAPTRTPGTAPSASPTPGSSPSQAPGLPTNPPSMGTDCNVAGVEVPGVYTSIETTGNVSGNTYIEDPSGPNAYTVVAYATPGTGDGGATPTPTATPNPNPTATPGPPTPVPSATNTPGPSPSPSGSAPNLFTNYIGIYEIPSFSGTIAGTSTPYTTTAATGCFSITLEQPASGTAGRFRRYAGTSGDDASGGGDPQIANPPYDPSTIDSGKISNFTIGNLTQTSGNGSFTLQNGTSGTVTITGSESYYSYDRPARNAHRRH